MFARKRVFKNLSASSDSRDAPIEKPQARSGVRHFRPNRHLEVIHMSGKSPFHRLARLVQNRTAHLTFGILPLLVAHFVTFFGTNCQ
jgi:hypothetical protein